MTENATGSPSPEAVTDGLTGIIEELQKDDVMKQFIEACPEPEERKTLLGKAVEDMAPQMLAARENLKKLDEARADMEAAPLLEAVIQGLREAGVPDVDLSDKEYLAEVMREVESQMSTDEPD